MNNKLNPPVLVDPDSKEEFEITEGHLKNSSGKTYKIIDSIPRIVETSENYADAFGEQWKRWRLTQLDSFTKTTISTDRLSRCLGLDLIKEIIEKEEMFILEAGCGAGRFTEPLLEFPSIHLTSTDLSSAVESNQLNFPQNENHRIVQCDLNKAPFKDDSFDAVVCLGVVQHTPNPEESIKSLLGYVKPGGWLVFDHYRPEFRRFTKLSAFLIRPILKRLPNNTQMKICEALVNFFLPFHKFFSKSEFAHRLFSRISPILSYYHSYPELSDELQKEWALLDTHDSLTDWFKHLRSAAQIKAVLEELKVKDLKINNSSHGVEVSCKKNNESS